MNPDTDIPAATDQRLLILVVDDEFDVAATYGMLFEFHGYRVMTAGNGHDALALAAAEPPALVMSDFMMPIMNGAELCRRWRADPALAAIPFILTSAGMAQLGDVPYDLFLRKPVPIDYLLKEIERLTQA
jgi:CheY-like chemotaxis protein